MISIVLVIIAFALLALRLSIGRFLFEIQRPWYAWLFPQTAIFASRWFRNLYDIVPVVAAIIIVLMAYSLHYGPIVL